MRGHGSAQFDGVAIIFSECVTGLKWPPDRTLDMPADWHRGSPDTVPSSTVQSLNSETESFKQDFCHNMLTVHESTY